MQKRATKVILAGLATLSVGIGAASTASAVSASAASLSTAKKAAQETELEQQRATAAKLQAAKAAEAAAAKKAAALKAMPAGTTTATSFWDPTTASGKPMSFKTLASPYWPLGTKVKIAYGGRSAVGVVEDFGPAEFAVAQHKIPAIVDISTPMMAHLSGSSDNSVVAQFQVLEWGKGGKFRSSGTGYDRAYAHAE